MFLYLLSFFIVIKKHYFAYRHNKNQEVINMIYPYKSIRNTSSTLVLLILCSQAFAKSALIDHAVIVGQSMSSFYMYNLSEGDQRYKEDYEALLIKADSTFVNYEKSDAISASDLKQKWQALRPQLNYDLYSNQDYFVPGQIRVQYRNYLNDLYNKVTENITKEAQLEQHLSLIDFNIEMISARFFDLTSSPYGVQSLTPEDMKLDPIKASLEIKQRLKDLKQLSNKDTLIKKISSIETKWNFIERTVINYKEESAFLLVYYNKRKIHQLINNSKDILMADI